MGSKILILSLYIFFFCCQSLSFADRSTHIEVFSPQGTVKSVRHVSVRFSEQMVPFGDPRLVDRPGDCLADADIPQQRVAFALG